MTDDAPGLSLLPPNRSLLEAGLDLAFAKLLERIEPPFPALMNPATTPVDFLPYLAADRGVSEWQPAAPEAEKRTTVGTAWEVKRLAGTRRALEQAVSSLQLRPEVTAWHEKTPAGTPYSFEVMAWAEQPFDEQTNARLDARLAAAKSERDVLTTRIGLSTRSRTYRAAALLCGELATIYPLQTTELEQSNPVYVAAALNTVETTTIYPLQEA
ncbi:phage tail protein I [Aquipseudomonas alcaligenes]|uniref:Phage tail protein I n=1 Tax=Aquipseudomonas alcaligenes TaxID=43263 RepID=A0A2V4LNR1_AQUAC|nr:phage tail protein I [Pseudomonas alcaligenes]PYC19546.1 phage tail protein I [Pseudomonas alcaligenes]